MARAKVTWPLPQAEGEVDALMDELSSLFLSGYDADLAVDLIRPVLMGLLEREREAEVKRLKKANAKLRKGR